MRKRLWLFAFGLAAVVLVGGGVVAVNYARPEAPVQPIAFSHKLHAGDYQMPCLYCHSYARRSPVAGVPSVQLCMGCHERNLRIDTPEIQKLKDTWERQEPIPWIRVYSVPDFVHFNHKRHVRAGVECQTCHGPVETLERVYQVNSLEMGWCIQCHQQRGASIDCATCHY
ncbi:MAG: cytochrome c3 family protein [Candidatus Acidoferrales bacterium]